MENRRGGTCLLALVALASHLVAGGLLAQEKEGAKDQAVFPGLHTELQLTGIGYGGPNDTAKFQEYRDLPQGGQADWISLDFENERQTYGFDLDVKKAGLEDMDLLFTGEGYGKWKLTFEFKRTPHRFLNDVGTLYSGIGTTEMRIPDAIQAAEEATVTDADMVDLLRANLHDGSVTRQIGLQRDQFLLSFTFIQLAPFSAGIDLSHEERQGDRPIGGIFAFGNALGLVEPIDYGTTDASIWAAYDKGGLHLKAFYGFRYFENRDGSLSFDNPFRNVDSTAADAADEGVNRQDGAREGKLALYPDNLEHRVGFEVGVDAPARTRITAGFTYRFRQDDPDLKAYTDNTAIVTGAIDAEGNPAVPFDAFNKANLPQRAFEGQVETERFNFQVTNRAIEHLEIRARYRLYNFDNESDQITFPGQVIVDAVWEPEEQTNPILQWTRHEGAVDFAYSLPCRTTATLGYKFVDMERDNREVDSSWDHIVLASLDSGPAPWFKGRVRYDHTWRRTDDYDFTAALQPTADPSSSGHFPFLRKFDETEFDRDRVNLQLTFPTASVTPTCGYTLASTDYDATFGLTSDIRHQVNAGLEADLSQRIRAGVSGNLEWSDTDQQGRQWEAGGLGDPFFTDTGEFSLSNWQASVFDRTLTLNSRMVFHLILEKLDLETFYTYMRAHEQVGFDSPVGTPADDLNPNDETLFDHSNADDSTWHNARVQFRWKVRKNLTIVFGYLFEKLDQEDLRYRGFTAVPTMPDGSYGGLFSLNREPQDYESHAGFVSVLWSF